MRAVLLSGTTPDCSKREIGNVQRTLTRTQPTFGTTDITTKP